MAAEQIQVHFLPLQLQYAPYLYETLQDPEVTRYLGLSLPKIEDTQRFIARLQQEERQGQSFARIIVNDRRQYVGFVSLFNIHPHKGIGELGLFLDKKHWGKGYPIPVHEKVLRLAFEDIGLQTIVYFTDRRNTKVRHLLSKFPMINMDQGGRYPLVVLEKWAHTRIWFDLHLLHRESYLSYQGKH